MDIILRKWNITRLPMPMIWHSSRFLAEGSDALKDNPICKDIDRWFSEFELFMLDKLRKCDHIGLDTKEIKETLEFCKSELTVTFLGYLISNKWYSGGQGNTKILDEGWGFLKDWMNKWKELDFQEVLMYKHMCPFRSSQSITPSEAFARLMTRRKDHIFMNILKKVVSDWKSS